MALPKLAEELYGLFAAESHAQCLRLLPPIKLELVKHNLLVPTPQNTQTSQQINDLKIAERILEIGALLLLLTADYTGFENYVALLRPFYNNPNLHAAGEANTDATKIWALYLVYVLAQGHISKFHVELEAIYHSPYIAVAHDRSLQYPIRLESSLMEGNYIQIWRLLQDNAALPAPEFGHFTESLVATLRHEIARLLEKSGDSIPVSNCKSLLYFPQEQSDSAFEDLLRELDIAHWLLQDGVVHFATPLEHTAASDNSQVIKNVLDYASQIESIV